VAGAGIASASSSRCASAESGGVAAVVARLPQACLPHVMAEPLKEVLFDKIMKMSCWSKLRLDTLPYWSQIEVCMHLRPLTVRDALCP
jgi:hypothetical protein